MVATRPKQRGRASAGCRGEPSASAAIGAQREWPSGLQCAFPKLSHAAEAEYWEANPGFRQHKIDHLAYQRPPRGFRPGTETERNGEGGHGTAGGQPAQPRLLLVMRLLGIAAPRAHSARVARDARRRRACDRAVPGLRAPQPVADRGSPRDRPGVGNLTCEGERERPSSTGNG
jgi:hypothetical protein